MMPMPNQQIPELPRHSRFISADPSAFQVPDAANDAAERAQEQYHEDLRGTTNIGQGVGAGGVPTMDVPRAAESSFRDDLQRTPIVDILFRGNATTTAGTRAGGNAATPQATNPVVTAIFDLIQIGTWFQINADPTQYHQGPALQPLPWPPQDQASQQIAAVFQSYMAPAQMVADAAAQAPNPPPFPPFVQLLFQQWHEHVPSLLFYAFMTVVPGPETYYAGNGTGHGGMQPLAASSANAILTFIAGILRGFPPPWNVRGPPPPPPRRLRARGLQPLVGDGGDAAPDALHPRGVQSSSGAFHLSLAGPVELGAGTGGVLQAFYWEGSSLVVSGSYTTTDRTKPLYLGGTSAWTPDGGPDQDASLEPALLDTPMPWTFDITTGTLSVVFIVEQYLVADGDGNLSFIPETSTAVRTRWSAPPLDTVPPFKLVSRPPAASSCGSSYPPPPPPASAADAALIQMSTLSTYNSADNPNYLTFRSLGAGYPKVGMSRKNGNLDPYPPISGRMDMRFMWKTCGDSYRILVAYGNPGSNDVPSEEDAGSWLALTVSPGEPVWDETAQNYNLPDNNVVCVDYTKSLDQIVEWELGDPTKATTGTSIYCTIMGRKFYLAAGGYTNAGSEVYVQPSKPVIAQEASSTTDVGKEILWKFAVPAAPVPAAPVTPPLLLFKGSSCDAWGLGVVLLPPNRMTVHPYPSRGTSFLQVEYELGSFGTAALYGGGPWVMKVTSEGVAYKVVLAGGGLDTNTGAPVDPLNPPVPELAPMDDARNAIQFGMKPDSNGDGSGSATAFYSNYWQTAAATWEQGIVGGAGPINVGWTTQSGVVIAIRWKAVGEPLVFYVVGGSGDPANANRISLNPGGPGQVLSPDEEAAAEACSL